MRRSFLMAALFGACGALLLAGDAEACHKRNRQQAVCCAPAPVATCAPARQRHGHHAKRAGHHRGRQTACCVAPVAYAAAPVVYAAPAPMIVPSGQSFR